MASNNAMEDIEVSTRAPESDAQEDALKQQSLRPSSNPTLGEHCTTSRPTPSSSEPQGELTTLAGVETYVSKPQFYPSQPAKLLLLLSPGTGIHSVNNQLQADLWAAQGYVVVMPDQFNSDPVAKMETAGVPASTADPAAVLDDTSGTEHGQGEASGSDTAKPTDPATIEEGSAAAPAPSLLARIKNGLVDAAKSFRIDMWLARHTPATVLPRLVAVLRVVEEVYADAVAYGGGVYGVGYCFGGRYVLLLSGELPADVLAGDRDVGASGVAGLERAKQQGGLTSQAGEETAYTGAVQSEEGMIRRGPWLKSGILAHGTGIGKEDFAALQKGANVGIVAVEDDPLFSDEVRDYGTKSAKERGVEITERVWAGVPHGFAVVGEYDDQKIQTAQTEAFDMMVDFIKSH